MAYRVELTPRTKRDLIDIYERISVDDSVAAARWFNGLERAIDSLEQFPHRCPAAPEAKMTKVELRNLLYGSRRDVYRVIYDIDESRKTVRVRAIRHGAMDGFTEEG